jgi:hypothetical protein
MLLEALLGAWRGTTRDALRLESRSNKVVSVTPYITLTPVQEPLEVGRSTIAHVIGCAPQRQLCRCCGEVG